MEPDNSVQDNTVPGVSADMLIAAERAERYRAQLDRPDVFPSRQNWQYITECRMDQLADLLYRKYLVSWLTEQNLRTDFHNDALECFPQFLMAIDREAALQTVYSDIASAPAATVALVEQCRLFDAGHLLDILHDQTSGGDPVVFVADCMSAYQPGYTDTDLEDMRILLGAMRNLEPLGQLRESRSIFGRETRYICPNGHSNAADCQFCQTCGRNRFGLTVSQAQNIDNFAGRITLLQRLLSKA